MGGLAGRRLRASETWCGSHDGPWHWRPETALQRRGILQRWPLPARCRRRIGLGTAYGVIDPWLWRCRVL